MSVPLLFVSNYVLKLTDNNKKRIKNSRLYSKAIEGEKHKIYLLPFDKAEIAVDENDEAHK